MSFVRAGQVYGSSIWIMGTGNVKDLTFPVYTLQLLHRVQDFSRGLGLVHAVEVDVIHAV
mgnify:CR=1 FL=1